MSKMCPKCKYNRDTNDFINDKGKTLLQCQNCRDYSKKYRLTTKSLLHLKKNITTINKIMDTIVIELPTKSLLDLTPTAVSDKKQHYFTGTGSQQQCFEDGDSKNHTCFIAYQQKLGSKWFPTYTSFPTINDFLTYQNTIPEVDRRFHEIIRKECPEYYDLDFKLDDWKGDTTQQKIENVLTDFLHLRNEFSYKNDMNNMFYKKEDLIVLESCGLNSKGINKLSLHIILRPELNKRNIRYFKCCKEQKIFTTLFSDFVKTQDTKIFIDLSVYNTNSLMRLLGSHKADETHRNFKTYTKNIFNPKLFFCSYIDLKKNDIPIEVKVIPKISVILDLPEDDIDLTDNEYKNLFDHLDVCRWDDYDTCLSLIWLAKKLNLSNSDIHSLCAKSEKYSLEWVQNIIDRRREDCPFTISTLLYYLKQDVDCDTFKNIVPPISNNYEKIKKIMKKRRTEEQQKFFENINNKIISQQIESLFDYKNNKFISKQDIPTDIEFVQDIVFPYLEGKIIRCVGIHAGLGRGKTSSLIRLVKSMPENAKVLILSPRITYATNICSEYNDNLDEKRQFTCYKNISNKKNLNFKNKIVISMESIHYLESYTPDLLIVDECNANLMSHISETNGKNIDDNLYQFRRLLTYSKHVVVADAFLGSKICNFFTDLQIPLHVYKYHRKLDAKNAIILKGLDPVVGKSIKSEYKDEKQRKEIKYLIDSTYITIIKLLEQGKKVYAYISSKKFLDRIKKATENKYKTLFYSGSSETIVPDNLNDIWSQYDLIATTCTITVGINHDKKNVFNTKIIDFNPKTRNNISDAIQCHYRVRNITDNNIYVKVDEDNVMNNFPVNMKNLDTNLQHKVDWYKKNGKCFESVEPYINSLIKHNFLENNLSQQAPMKMMIRYLEDCNYTIIQSDIERRDIDDIPTKEQDDDENVNLLREFMRNEPNQSRMIKLEKEKLIRKLTDSELEEMDKFWFIKMYTGGTSQGFRETNLPTIALAYRLWIAKFKGNKTIRAMRMEKQVLNGELSIEELIEKRWDKSQYAQLQNVDIIKIKRVIDVCKKLGLKHSNDTETIITQDTMDAFYEEAKTEYDNIRLDMSIQDKRTDKKKVDKKNFTGLVKSCFTNSDQSLCNLKVHNSIRKKIKGKVERTNTYKLYPDEYITKQACNINRIVEEENKKEDKNLHYNTLDYKVADNLYEIMDLTEKKEDIHKRLL